MAFRLRNFAPLGPEEGLNGWLHKLAGWHRQVFGVASDRYIAALLKQGQAIGAVARPGGELAVCQICGYQMASLSCDDGWTIEACSHSVAGKMFANSRFDRWRQQLPQLADAKPLQTEALPDQSSHSSNHLQTSSP